MISSTSANSIGLDLSVLKNLAAAGNKLNQSSQRLATLSRINSGKDDPAGLIAVEQIRAELAAIEAADRNAARAASTVQVADSGLERVGDLLNSIQGNVVATAGDGFSDAEVAAAQIEVDAALEAINRIAATTGVGGRPLLDASSDEISFALSSDPGETVSLALPNVHTSSLGGSGGALAELASGGSANLASGNLTDAVDILAAAREQVNTARAEAGALGRFTIDSAQIMIAAAQANLSEGASMIADANVAAESSRFVRAQLLMDSAIASVHVAGQRHRLTSTLLDAL